MVKSKKVNKGEYLYRGFKVYCFGYYEPEHRTVWEGIDEISGEGVARGYTKREVISEIDYFMDRE